MKTGYHTTDAVCAAFQGKLQLPVFSDLSFAQMPDPPSFYNENSQKIYRGSGRRSAVLPLSLALRVFRRIDHRDKTGFIRPAINGKEVMTHHKMPVFSTLAS